MLNGSPGASKAGSVIQRLERLMTSPILWGVFLATGLATLFRQYLLAHSYWYDEAYLILAIREHSYAALLGAQPYNLVIPPMFLWITRALHELSGDQECMLRLLPFLAGVASLFVMMPLAKKVIGGPHALWAFAWLALSRNLVAHACEVRPYTVDLLLIECILLCSVILLQPASGRVARACALGGLGALAALGPWLSFPTAFGLGGASLVFAVQLARYGSRGEWSFWAVLNVLFSLSVLSLWLLSGRHMYYGGMLEHWGPKGWWGFPNWHSPANMSLWLISRPYEIANHGSRELGLVLPFLALVGGCTLAKRRSRLCGLLLAPVVLSLAAALLGKYPLAHRTSFFLLPCLWLLAASGFGATVEWAKRYGWNLAVAGLLLVACDFTWSVVRVVKPDRGLDYRGAYAFMYAHCEHGDAVWSQNPEVYEVYYGKRSPIPMGGDLGEAAPWVRRQRLWAILGPTRNDLRQRIEAAGGQLILCHQVSGLAVLLFESKTQHRLPSTAPAETVKPFSRNDLSPLLPQKMHRTAGT